MLFFFDGPKSLRVAEWLAPRSEVSRWLAATRSQGVQEKEATMSNRLWIVMDIDYRRNCVTANAHRGKQEAFRLKKSRRNVSRHFLSPEQASQAVERLLKASCDLSELVADD